MFIVLLGFLLLNTAGLLLLLELLLLLSLSLLVQQTLNQLVREETDYGDDCDARTDEDPIVESMAKMSAVLVSG